MNPQDQIQSIDQNQVDDSSIRNPLQTMQKGEHIIFEVKRHPIGIFTTYFIAGLTLIILAVLALVVAPSLASSENRNHIMAIGSVVFIIFAILTLIFVFIANKVYWGNSWILTSDSITQVVQTSLFNKQSSQLSLNNLEDVTAEKNGILASMFNFGVVRAETAGERSKFVFIYCPNPNFYAQKVLQAREVFEQFGRYEAPKYQEGQAVPGSTQFTGNPDATYPERNDSAGGPDTPPPQQPPA